MDRTVTHDSAETEDEREVEEVRRFVAALGLPGIVDVHTHFMPSNVMDKVWRYFDSAGPLTGRPWPITYRHDEDERVARLRAFGVRAFTSMIYPHKPAMAAWLNGWARDFALRTPDCVRTATFFPEPGAADYVRDAVDSGVGIFKSHIQVGDYSPDDPLLEGVWGTIEDAGLPVVIHCGSGPAPGRFTGPGPIAGLLARFPRLPLVIAHMGMPEYGEFLDLATRYPNVHLDTTMAFTDFSEEVAPFPTPRLPQLVELRDRILFGSDFPNIPYRYLHALEGLTRFDLGDDWLRAVVHDNGARLFPGTAGGPLPAVDG